MMFMGQIHQQHIREFYFILFQNLFMTQKKTPNIPFAFNYHYASFADSTNESRSAPEHILTGIHYIYPRYICKLQGDFLIKFQPIRKDFYSNFSQSEIIMTCSGCQIRTKLSCFFRTIYRLFLHRFVSKSQVITDLKQEKTHRYRCQEMAKTHIFIHRVTQSRGNVMSTQHPFLKLDNYKKKQLRLMLNRNTVNQQINELILNLTD